MKYSGKTVARSLSYKFIEQLAVKGTSLLVGIILARLLDVEDFGVLALLTVFTHLASALIEGGLSTSLIQMKEVDSKDYSTVFYTSFALAIVLYGIIFAASPYIAIYYEDAKICTYLRVISLSLFTTPFNAVQLGVVYRNMLFKKLMISTLIASILSGGIGILMAYGGMGPWALIGQTLGSGLISVLILFIVIPWKPTAEFSFQKLKYHFSFGWKLLLSSLLETGYNELRTLIIGKRYSSDDLSYYNRGDTYPKTIIMSLNTAVQTVMFPVLSSEQSHMETVKQLTRKSVSLSSYVLFPVMAGFAAVAYSFVDIVLTEKWLPCVIYLQLACITYAIMPINSCNLQAIKAIGRSDIFLVLTLIKKVLGILLVFTAIWLFDTPLAVAIAAAIYAPLELFINAYPNQKLIHYTVWEQIRDIFPSLFMSLVMFAGVYILRYWIVHSWLCLLVQIIVGILLYLGLTLIFKKDMAREILRRIR